LVGNSPNVASAEELYISTYSLDALTPNHVLTQFSRAKRRNLILGISISLAFLYLANSVTNLEISSVLFIKFSEPLSDLKPIIWMMAIFIAYFELSFLFDFYSDMKRVMVKIDGLRFYTTGALDDWVRGTEQFDFDDRDNEVIRLKGLNSDAAIGDRRIEVETVLPFQVSDLFLVKNIRKRAEWAVRLRKWEVSGTWNVISGGALTAEESTYLTKAQEDWSKKVMKTYRKKVYLSLLWWYEIFIPLFVGMATLLFILNKQGIY
jgi:hypothetical protein